MKGNLDVIWKDGFEQICAPEGYCFYYINYNDLIPDSLFNERFFQRTSFVALIKKEPGNYAKHYNWAKMHNLKLWGGSFYKCSKSIFDADYKVIHETDKNPKKKMQRWVRKIEDKILLSKI